jgi:hypothetical protein
LEITDILGYINNFVEHDGVKVIIISNEKEISERFISRNLELKMLVSAMVAEREGLYNQNQISAQNKNEKTSASKILSEKLNSLFDKTNEYKRIKEKLNGKTLTLLPDYPNLIENIINDILNEELKDFLIKNLQIIINTFIDSGTENIRILKQALEDFDFIFERVKGSSHKLTDDLLVSILKFTLSASFEIKSGAEGNNELERVKSNDDFLSTICFARIMKNKE